MTRWETRRSRRCSRPCPSWCCSGTLGLLRVPAHIAALCLAWRRRSDCRGRLHDACADGVCHGGLRDGVRPLSDRLDRAQRHLSLSADERARAVYHPACEHHHGHSRSAIATAARGILFRRVLRGRGGIRHAGRGDRRDADGPRFHAAGRVRLVAHRKHGTGRLWRARHADHRAADRDGSRSL